MNNIIQFASASAPAFEEVTVINEIRREAGEAIPEAPKRSRREWITPQELRGLLKEKGWNARKVTVTARHSIEYLRVVVRDANVELAALEAFVAEFHTWKMGMDDCRSGQSVSVEISDEVRKAYGERNAEFLKEQFKAQDFDSLNDGQGVNITEEIVAWRESPFWGYFQKNGDHKRYSFNIGSGIDFVYVGTMFELCKLRSL